MFDAVNLTYTDKSLKIFFSKCSDLFYLLCNKTKNAEKFDTSLDRFDLRNLWEFDDYEQSKELKWKIKVSHIVE